MIHNNLQSKYKTKAGCVSKLALYLMTATTLFQVMEAVFFNETQARVF